MEHCKPTSVNLLRAIQWQLKIKDHEIATHLGISRSYVTQMMNQNVPFIEKYYTKIDDFFFINKKLRLALLNRGLINE